VARELASVRIQAEDDSQSAWDSFTSRGLQAYRAVEGGVAGLGTAWDRFVANMGPAVQRGFEETKSAFQSFVDYVQTKLTIAGVAVAVGVSAAALGAIYAAYKAADFAVGLLTGESYKSANIEALRAMNQEVKGLQESLPLTATGASALNEALKAQGVTASAYTATINGVSTAVRSNSEELERLGVKYKDENGNLLATRTILENASKVLGEYTEGWDRQQAAAALGLGSEKQIQEALKITAENTQVAKDRLIAYGLIIGEGTQEAVQRYESSMRAFDRELDLMSQGFKRAIADNVMPLLTDLADFFRDGFPAAVMAFRYSMATVTSLFYGLKTSVYIVAESILGSIESMGSGFGGLAIAATRALSGDFSGARQALVQGWEEARTRLGQVGENIVEQARRNGAAMRQAWGIDSLTANGQADARTPSGGRTWVPKPTPDAAAGAGVESPFNRLMKAMEEEEARLRGGGELSAGQKLDIELKRMRADALAKLTDAQLKQLQAEAQTIDSLRAQQALSKSAIAAIEAQIKAQEELDAATGGFSTTNAGVLKDLEFQTKIYNMEAEAMRGFAFTQADLTRQTLEFNIARETATQLQKLENEYNRVAALIATDEAKGYDEKEAALSRLNKAYENQRQALGTGIRDNQTARSAVEQIRDTQAAARDFERDLNRGITDALFRSFGSWRKFRTSFFETLKNAAKTTVLRPVISFLLQPLTGAVTATWRRSGFPGLQMLRAGAALRSARCPSEQLPVEPGRLRGVSSDSGGTGSRIRVWRHWSISGGDCIGSRLACEYGCVRCGCARCGTWWHERRRSGIGAWEQPWAPRCRMLALRSRSVALSGYSAAKKPPPMAPATTTPAATRAAAASTSESRGSRMSALSRGCSRARAATASSASRSTRRSPTSSAWRSLWVRTRAASAA
jgi:hypothetical protein